MPGGKGALWQLRGRLLARCAEARGTVQLPGRLLARFAMERGLVAAAREAACQVEDGRRGEGHRGSCEGGTVAVVRLPRLLARGGIPGRKGALWQLRERLLARWGCQWGEGKGAKHKRGKELQQMRHWDAMLSEDPLLPTLFAHLLPRFDPMHQGFPAMALSLDNHQARKVDDYNVAAKLSVSLIKVRGAKA